MKEQTATRQLRVWLNAVGIQCRPRDQWSLWVHDKDGNPFICELAENPQPCGAVNVLRVPGKVITGRSLRASLEAFRAFQALLGYEPKMPVDRGEIPDHKLVNGESFELPALRHTELRRVPNPSPAQLKRYDLTINRAVGKFYRKNRGVCANHLLGVDDLKSFAQMWTVTFIAMVEIDAARPSDNDRLLYAHLAQRFSTFLKNLRCMARSTLPNLDEAFIGTHGRPYDYKDFKTWETTNEQDEVDEAYVRNHCKLDVSDPAARRKSAAKLLDRELEALGHEGMVEVLRTAAKNDRICGDARGEAIRRLNVHYMDCSTCEAEELSPVEEDEEVGGGDAGGAVEQVLDGA